MHRRTALLACLSLATAPAAVPAAAAAPCARAAALKSRVWFVATPPLPPPSPLHQSVDGAAARIRAVAVDPSDARVVLVSDGAHVQRSDDGGCTWRRVYSLPAAPGVLTPDFEAGQIRSVEVTRVAGRTRVLLAVQGVGHGMPQPVRTVLVRSDDGYGGWQPVSDPLFAGTHHASRGAWAPVVRATPAVAYAAVPGAGGEVAYFRSTDGGATWTLRSSPADPLAPVSMTGFAVSPWDPDELWEWGGRWSRLDDRLTGLRRSTDGGASWSQLDPWATYGTATRPSWLTADVAWPRRGGPARVLVLGEAPGAGGGDPAPVAAWSGDGGQSFRVALPPTRGVRLYDAAVTHLANGDAVVVAANRFVYRVPHRGRAPVGPDWVQLPKVPEEASRLINDSARAGATMPGVVAVPTPTTVQLLTVSR